MPRPPFFRRRGKAAAPRSVFLRIEFPVRTRVHPVSALPGDGPERTSGPSPFLRLPPGRRPFPAGPAAGFGSAPFSPAGLLPGLPGRSPPGRGLRGGWSCNAPPAVLLPPCFLNLGPVFVVPHEKNFSQGLQTGKKTVEIRRRVCYNCFINLSHYHTTIIK